MERELGYVDLEMAVLPKVIAILDGYVEIMICIFVYLLEDLQNPKRRNDG